MPTVPSAIREFAEGIPYPVALIGCRSSEMPLDCCEYDLAVFAAENENNQIVQIGPDPVELLHFAGPVRNYIVELRGMAILSDTKFELSSASKEITPEKYEKALVAEGKKSLISSLFCQQKMRQAKHVVIAAMWLKIASYDFIGGMLCLSGSRPMPLHELEQVRNANTGNMIEGIEIALECIGTERATRPAIARSIEAVNELKSNDYDRKLLVSKVNHLVRRKMLVDCYYYAGRVAAKKLRGRHESFYSKYTKLIQLAMDLTSDAERLEKLQERLFRAANGSLKC